MNLLKILPFVSVVGAVLLFGSCRPEVEDVEPPAGDTVIIRDTTIINDTTVIRDTTLVVPDTEGTAVRDSRLAFLSVYPTAGQLVRDGDDDEASAWLWFHERYPEGQYLYFGDVTAEGLDSMRVLFWLRDIETGNVDDVFAFSAEVQRATPIIREWYRRGGNVVLWGHAVVYIEELGRLPKGTYTAPSHDMVCSCGKGQLDMGSWQMAVQLNLAYNVKIDNGSHPLFQGISIYTNNDTRLIGVKGPGWTEDHNCVFYNYPSELTGRDWQQEACYKLLTEYYGIYPLATWDSQIWWVSQLNIYECRQGQTDYKGHVLCIGNGGCEFSMKSYEQTGTDEQNNPVYTPVDDRSAYPVNNIYQDNILRMASNAIEYMRNL